MNFDISWTGILHDCILAAVAAVISVLSHSFLPHKDVTNDNSTNPK